MKNILLLLIISAVLFSCNRKLRQPSVIQRTDSTVTSNYTVERDTPIIMPYAKVSAQLSLSRLKPEMPPVTKQSDQARLKLAVDKKGNLQADCECDTFSILAKLKDNYSEKTRTVTVTDIQKVEVRYIPWYVKISAWIGLGTLILILVWILSMIRGFKIGF